MLDREDEVRAQLEEASDTAVVELRVELQAWIRDHARRVDDGVYHATVPIDDLKHNGKWLVDGGPNHFVSDGLKSHSEMPVRVRDWQGPFRIKVESIDD
jgi:hypothetical protein